MKYLNLAEWAEEPMIIKIHVIVAVLALLIGAAVLLMRKGTGGHRALGRVFACCALATAATSFLIHEIRLWGIWSPIHLLSIMVIFGIWRAVRAVRRGNVVAHIRLMQSVYLWGFVVAGAFTLLPSRTLGEVFLARAIQAVSGGIPSVEMLLAVALPVTVTLVALWLRLRPRVTRSYTEIDFASRRVPR